MCGVRSFPAQKLFPHLGNFSVTGNHSGVGMYSRAKLTLLGKTYNF